MTPLTFPNCSKYCFTSSTTVLADKPPTNIFFVLVTIWKKEREREGRGGDGERRGLQMRRAATLMRLQTRRVNLHLPREANRQEATHPHKCGRKSALF